MRFAVEHVAAVDRRDGRGCLGGASCDTTIVVPDELRWLFWDIDPESLDLERHRDYVLERVMSRGDLAAIHWIVGTYPVSVFGDFLARKGACLTPRDRAFWSLIAGVTHTPEPGGGRPVWAG